MEERLLVFDETSTITDAQFAATDRLTDEGFRRVTVTIDGRTVSNGVLVDRRRALPRAFSGPSPQRRKLLRAKRKSRR